MNSSNPKPTILLIAFLVLSGNLVLAQENRLNAQQQAKWEQFKSTHGDHWDVTINDKTSLPRIIFGGLSKPYQGTPVQQARKFLSDYYELFGFEPSLSDLKFVETREQQGVQHVTFQQYYKGIKVDQLNIRYTYNPGER